MNYSMIHWLHDFPDEPVTLYHELDTERWEVRKVEKYRDGTLRWTDAEHEDDFIALGQMPHPSAEEIMEDPQFVVEDLTADEFEHIWAEAKSNLK